MKADAALERLREVERTFSRGAQRWRVDEKGQWSVYMWGWWPTGASPRGQFMPVETKKVPRELLDAAAR